MQPATLQGLADLSRLGFRDDDVVGDGDVAVDDGAVLEAEEDAGLSQVCCQYIRWNVSLDRNE